MAKAIPAKEFKAAVKALNATLDKENKIKVVGVKKEDVVEAFTNQVLDFIENDKASDLPEEVIDFYNDHIVDDGTDEGDEEKTEEKPKGKAKGKAKAKKEPKERRTHFVPNKNGRPLHVVAAIKEGGTQDEIVARADEMYIESGGSSNENQSKRLFENAVRYLFYADVLEISDDGVYTFKG